MTTPAGGHGEDGYLTIHGLRHHYIRWGEPEAEPIVFLHGLMNNARYWEHIAGRFSGSYGVYAPDLRGHGESEHAPGEYLVWAFAMDLRGFVEEMDFEALVPVGRWKGFGGETDFNGAGFECYRLAGKERLCRAGI